MSEFWENFPCVTSTVGYFYEIFKYTYIAYGIFHLCFFAELSIPTFVTTISIILSVLLIKKASEPLKSLVDYIHEKNGTGKLEQIRNEVLIGLGGITLCGVIPRIIVYFFADNEYVIWYIDFISLYFMELFQSALLTKPRENWAMNRALNKKQIGILVTIHVIALVVASRIASIWYTEEDGSRIIIHIQLVYAAICAATTVDILGILRGGIKFANNTESAAKEESKPAAVVVDDSPIRVECKICTLEYSARYIPRILKECGHTICEKCANKLLEENDKQHLFCPYCQAVTVVKGPAKLLPKNYAMLELVEEIRSRFSEDEDS